MWWEIAFAVGITCALSYLGNIKWWNAAIFIGALYGLSNLIEEPFVGVASFALIFFVVIGAGFDLFQRAKDSLQGYHDPGGEPGSGMDNGE